MTGKGEQRVEIRLGEADMAKAEAMANAMDAFVQRGGPECPECDHLLAMHRGGPIGLRTIFSGTGCINFFEIDGCVGRCGCDRPGNLPD